MVEAVISLLVYACIIALCFYLVIYVLRDVIGVPFPGKAIQIVWAIFGLIVLLMLWRLFVTGGFALPRLR